MFCFGGAPSGDDDFRGLNHGPDLRNHDSLDLRRRHAADRASGRSVPEQISDDVIAIELAAFPSVCRRHRGAGRSEDQTLQESRGAAKRPLGAGLRRSGNQGVNLIPEVACERSAHVQPG